MVNFVAWHDRTQADHLAETQKWADQGFRTSSLSVYGDRADPRYAAVMVKRPAVHAEEQWSALTLKEFFDLNNKNAVRDMRPYLISATGPADNPLIAVSFRPDDEVVFHDDRLTETNLYGVMYSQWNNGLWPISFDAYGEPGDVRYIGLWRRNVDRTPWNCECMAAAVDLATIQARYDAITRAWGRMADIVQVPGGRHLGLFVTTQRGGTVAYANTTSAEYQEKFDQQTAQGRYPARVTAVGSGADTRFAAIFNEREDPVDRAPSSNGPTHVEGVDAAMLKYMAAHDIRGGALAIVSGTRLVYARGYRYAEAGYPEVLPTTLFRQASVSKLFAAAAVRKLVQDGAKTEDGQAVTLDTKMQAVLKLETPDGGAPADERFGDITLRHLLESNAALDQGVILSDVAASQAHAGAKLPCAADELAAYAASLPMTAGKTPGDPANTVYGNTEYFLLSRVVRKLGKKANFEAALRELVLDPLKMARVRGSRSTLAAQADDEARYHEVKVKPTPANGWYNDWWQTLTFGPSVRSDDRPTVAHPYGALLNYELCDGCGGLSAAVTDVARLLACLNLHAGNPVFAPDTLQKWFQDVVDASKHTGPKAHGYHGFDSGSTDPAKPILDPWNFSAGKGGWVPSHASSVVYHSGGLSFVVAFNSVAQADVKADWFNDPDGDGKPDAAGVWGAALAHDWSKQPDLFPTFGMPSFPSPSSKLQAKFQVKLQAKLPQAAALRLPGARALEDRMRDTMTAQIEASRARAAPAGRGT